MTQYPDIRFRKRTDCDNIDWFEVTEDCEVKTLSKFVIAHSQASFVIPKGYTTDFASVPRGLWSFFPPHGLMTNASVVHDFMYDTRLFESEMMRNNARRFADREFLFNCLDGFVPAWQAVLIYAVIRLMGRSWWAD